MTTKKATCAIIIVTHNSELHIHKAMDCLKKQTHPADQIIIVDSGSKDLHYLTPYSLQPDTQVIFADKDIGFCKGNNIGMSKITPECDYVFFLNPDAFPTPKFLEEAIAFMEDPGNQDYAALTGTVLGYDITDDQPTGKYDSTGVFQKWYGKWYDRHQGMNYNPTDFPIRENVPAICGAVLFCRKKALDSVLIRGNEVFDNTFFMYKEDIDLSLRLRKKGWKLALVPQLLVYHCRGWNRDRKKMPRELKLFSAKNELKLHARHSCYVGTAYSFIKYAAVKMFDM